MADVMTMLLCRKEVISKGIEKAEEAMSRIPKDFVRYKEMESQVNVMKETLEKIAIEIYRERKQGRLFPNGDN